MTAAMSHADLDTVKIGMLGTIPTIEAVAEGLKSQPWKNIVLDPVLICKVKSLGWRWIPIPTRCGRRSCHSPPWPPRITEACTLAGLEKMETLEDLAEAAMRISSLGPKYVVVKGGMDFPVTRPDVLWDGEQALAFSVPKIGDARIRRWLHFAAAITAELAKGADIHKAVRIAKDLVTQGIDAQVKAKRRRLAPSGRARFRAEARRGLHLRSADGLFRRLPGEGESCQRRRLWRGK